MDIQGDLSKMMQAQQTTPSHRQPSMMTLISRFVGQKNVLVTNVEFIKYLDGDHLAAMLLSQLIYWTERTKNPDGWVAKTYAEWFDELYMSKYQIGAAVKRLAQAGVETSVKKFAGVPTVHYRINENVFSAWVSAKLNGVGVQNTGENDVWKVRNLTMESQKTSLSIVKKLHNGKSKNLTNLLHRLPTENTSIELELDTDVSNSPLPAPIASVDHVADAVNMVSPIGETGTSKKSRKKAATSADMPSEVQTHTPDAESTPEATQTRKALQTATIFYFGLKPKDGGDWSFVQKMVNFFTGSHKKDKSAWYENQFTDKPMTAAEIAGFKLNRLKFTPTTPEKIFADASMWRMSDVYEADLKRGEDALTELLAGREPLLIKEIPSPEAIAIVSKWWRSNNPGQEPKQAKHEPEHPIYVYLDQAKHLIEMGITADELGAFLGDLRGEAFWDGKIISWDYVFNHIAAWKVTHDFYNPPNSPQPEEPTEPISEEQRQANLAAMAKIRAALTAKMTISASQD